MNRKSDFHLSSMTLSPESIAGYFQEEYTRLGVALSDLLAPLIGLLADRRFRTAVSQLTGYDVSVMGAIILED